MNGILLRWAWLAAYTAGCLYFVYFVERSSFSELLLVFAFLFILYGWALYRAAEFKLKEIIWISLFLRLLFFLGTPQLSDDYHRFLWDGELVNSGENPYRYLPSEYIEKAPEDFSGRAYYDDMNSPDYYSVYPPLKQAVFATAAWFASGDAERGVLALRVILLLAELLFLLTAARLLTLFHLPVGRLVIYAFHPLVVVEVIGNVHFEGMVLLFMALALLAGGYAASADQAKKRSALLFLVSGFFFACAVLVKLTPLLLGPIAVVLLRRFSRVASFALGALIVLVVSIWPFADSGLLAHLQSSLGLYFRTFEFNASVYYLVRAVGHHVLGYNAIARIGPMLSIISTLTIVALTVRLAFFKLRDIRTVAPVVLWSWVLFLVLSTTVHSWYLVVLVGIAMFAKHWAVLAWTCTVVLSYAHYRGGGFEENYGLITVSYVLPLLVALVMSRIKHVRLMR